VNTAAQADETTHAQPERRLCSAEESLHVYVQIRLLAALFRSTRPHPFKSLHVIDVLVTLGAMHQVFGERHGHASHHMYE